MNHIRVDGHIEEAIEIEIIGETIIESLLYWGLIPQTFRLFRNLLFINKPPS